MLITGASRGIGAATVLLAARRGWSVAIGFRADGDAAERVADACRAFGGRAFTHRGEVNDEVSMTEFFERCRDQLAAPTAVVHSAGIVAPIARVEDMTMERVRHMFEVNVLGSFLCGRLAVRHMATDLGGPGGSITFVSSAASYLGSPNEFVDYAASKGAIDTLTVGLAKEVARRGIRVNAVRPGLIDTDIHADAGVPDRVDRLKDNVPIGRGGTPEEVAGTILYLAGQDAGYVTGALINVSGGR